MGFVGDMLSGGKGAGFQAQGLDPAQVGRANQQVNDSIFQQKDFAEQLANQAGLQKQTSVFAQQQDLANQLQGIGNGTGPNPAMAQLNQQTGRNVANQAALMAGQRGGSANTGLLARQAANQGANLQQQAVGQGATLQAQQQLAALQQLQNQQSSMGNMANTLVNQRQAAITGYNQNTLQNQANTYGLQSNINSTNAGIAGGNQAAQGNILGGLAGGVGSAFGMLGGGGGGIAASGGTAMAGGAGDAIGGMADAGTMVAAQGGMIPKKMAEGGMPDANPLTPDIPNKEVAVLDQPQLQGPKSNVGKMFNDSGPVKSAAAKSGGAGGLGGLAGLAGKGLMNWGIHEALPYLGSMFGEIGSGLGAAAGSIGPMAGGAGDAIGTAAGTEAVAAAPAAAEIAVAAARGGKVSALVSPGEQYLRPNDVSKVKQGANPLVIGERIPGKPKHPGNNYANDTVPKQLDEGGIVIPNSIMQSKNASAKAAKFIDACLAKDRKSLPKKAK